MTEHRTTQPRIVSTLPEAASYPEQSVDEPLDEVEPVEDTVPYLPPLASYPVTIHITEILRGVPHIYPDEILEEDE
jgi:hypothetical protein